MLKIRLFCLFAALFSVFLMCGCNSVKYTGETLPALDSPKRVTVFYDKSQINGNYHVMGLAEYTVPFDTFPADIRDDLKKSAAANGANAILIESMDKVKMHTARADQLRNKTKSDWSIEESSHTSFEYVQDSIRNKPDPNDANQNVFKIHVKAHFLSLSPEAVRNLSAASQELSSKSKISGR